MRSEQIAQKAGELIAKHCTRDPFLLAQELGVTVLWRDDFTLLKGMYTVVLGNRFIFLNRGMDERMSKIVCAHELGHDSLHRSLAADSALREFMLYDMDTRPEYEANIFAAELLLPDEEILEYVRMDFDAAKIAAVLCTDINLVALKLSNLSRRGFDLRFIESRSDFLKSRGENN